MTSEFQLSAVERPYHPPSGRLAEGLRHERAGDGAWALAVYEALVWSATSRDATPEEIVMALLRISSVHRIAGRRELALDIAEAAVYIAAANGLGPELAHGLVAQSSILFGDDRVEEAERMALAGRAQAEATGAEIAVAIADNILGVIASQRGNISEGLLRFASALAYGQRAGDDFLSAMCLNNIGRAYLGLGMPEEAIPRLETASDMGADHHPMAGAAADCLLATLLSESGDTAQAERRAARAMETAMRLDSPRIIADACTAAACVAISLGQFDAAASHLRLARAVARQDWSPEADADFAICELSLGLKARRPGPALSALERAETCHIAVPDMWSRRRILQRSTELQSLVDTQCERWLRSLDGRRPGARVHAHRVRALATMLAGVAKLDDGQRRSIGVAALLHDIGCLWLPEPVQRQTGVFSDVEREIVHAHAELGDAVLADEGFPTTVRRIVRHHHEHHNGTGYPDRLHGDAIPIGARIVAIAERFDALRSPRDGRKPLTEAQALKVLESESGHAFDPALCAEFVSAVRAGLAEAAVPSAPIREIDPSLDGPSSLHATHGRRVLNDALAQIRRVVGSRYHIERELGGSATAHVFLAQDPLLGRHVVIKALYSHDVDDTAIARFRREMSVAARLRHPNVLPVLDARIDGSVLFFVTPFINGGSLRQRLDSGPVPVPLEEARRILRDVASALAEAHAHGVIHRDIKPENILLDRDRNDSALLADFGIARLADIAMALDASEKAMRLTHTGVSIGTPSYMAPEQVFAQTDLDARVDVYAFGLVAFELLTGEAPFVRRTAREVMVAHLTCAAPDLAMRRPEVPPELSALVARALQKNPDDRFTDGGALLAALDGVRNAA